MEVFDIDKMFDVVEIKGSHFYLLPKFKVLDGK